MLLSLLFTPWPGAVCRYSKVHLVGVDALQTAELPLSLAGFEELVRAQCEQARTILRDR